ncbi:hypothetical protein [Sphingobacterium kitahiroshimense]|uniref:hypothetical protein n=1 Tax=Sphingobacterium kitahiroshimense TaxID=470446 RepID=UPI00320B3DFC
MSRLEIISTKQRPRRKYLAVQNSNNESTLLNTQSEIISTFPSNKVLIILQEKDFENAIKIFLISKLRKYYVSVLWIGFFILCLLEFVKSVIKKYVDKPNIEIETTIYLRKIADIGIPMISLAVMTFLLISVYRLLSTASIIKVRSLPLDRKK